MIVLVISTPRQSKLSKELVEARLAFRAWIKSRKKRVICFYPRRDRGASVIFNLRSRRELTSVLRKWRSFVRARLDVYPLRGPEESGKLLEKKRSQLRRKELARHGRTAT